ncbi:MAG TPA: translesion error-prone DNA polymerase V autoproteolytic subunit [Chitinophagaceae bacterium]
METEDLYYAEYKGSKDYGQQDVPTTRATGFGAAADDYAERGIDLNEQLIRNKPATYFMRVNGNTMTGAGIHNGDVVIVDRSLKPRSGNVVIAVLNGEMLIRRYEEYNRKVRLVPEGANLATIDVDPGADFWVWGVVTYAIHSV